MLEGSESVSYTHLDVYKRQEKYLSETYGITVFQEQVMLLSRLLANFTRGDSDTLRKAMGKKDTVLMEQLKVKFVSGCKANFNFLDECKLVSKSADDVIEKIWKDWTAFASYAFNKSHSVDVYKRQILDGAASIDDLVNKAKSSSMPALALTDHGTMFGVKEFHEKCLKAKIKPIIGCETYVAERSRCV